MQWLWAMTSSVKLGFLFVLVACGGPVRHVPAPAPPVFHAAVIRGCDPVAVGRAPTPARRLLAATTELEIAGRDHVRLLHALRGLADAMESVAPSRAGEILQVRLMSNTLERSVANTSTRADFVRIGLAAAAAAFAAIEPPAKADLRCFEAGLAAMTAATSNIDPGDVLATQYPQVRAALHAAVTVVFAADAPAPATAQR